MTYTTNHRMFSPLADLAQWYLRMAADPLWSAETDYEILRMDMEEHRVMSDPGVSRRLRVLTCSGWLPERLMLRAALIRAAGGGRPWVLRALAAEEGIAPRYFVERQQLWIAFACLMALAMAIFAVRDISFASIEAIRAVTADSSGSLDAPAVQA